MNKVMLVGRLTRDPELRTSQTGMQFASFSLAINRNFRNKDGVVEADFINVVAFGKNAETIGKYVTKGQMIGVEGRIQTRSYDAQDGTKRYSTDVVVDSFEFLSSKNSNTTNSSVNSNPVNAYVDTTSSFYVDEPSRDTGVDVGNEDLFKSFGNEVALSDDDLPF